MRSQRPWCTRTSVAALSLFSFFTSPLNSTPFLSTGWRFGLVVTLCSTPGPVSTGMGDRVRVSTAGKSISVYSQPPRSTQPGHPSVGRCNADHRDCLYIALKLFLRDILRRRTVLWICYTGSCDNKLIANLH